MRLNSLPDNIKLRLESASELVEADLQLLSDEELSRYNSFGHIDRKRGFLLGRKAAYALLEGHENQQVRINVRNDGSLEVEGLQCHLSISHARSSDQMYAVASVGNRDIGVDVEVIVDRRADLYTRILYPDEFHLLQTDGLAHNEAQLLLWSLKEAVLKGLRTGFRRSARSVHLDDLSDGTGHAHLNDGPSWHLRYTRLQNFWISVAYLDE